jgi:hypothetical protein
MANLIRLKQIESGSSLNTAASVGADFSASVIDVVTGQIAATLPDGVISSSAQLDGTTINNLTLATTGDNYSLIVSGALAVVDADVVISGVGYDVPGEIWINGRTGSAGNPPAQPYDNIGNAVADIIDNGTW